MTIQKKSLISSLNTTKKAIVASSPLETPTATEKSVKLAKPSRLAKVNNMSRLAKVNNMSRLAKVNSMARLGKVSSMSKLGKV